jgi:FMN-dependent NADH-azoreductase
MLLIDTPMNNFTVPAALKTWIDLVVRPRRTFGYAPDGRKQGMLADRPVFLLVACGGTFGAGPAAQTDFLTPYLRYVLGCVGLADLRPLLLERMTRGAEEVARAEAMAAEWMAAQLAGLRGG